MVILRQWCERHSSAGTIALSNALFMHHYIEMGHLYSHGINALELATVKRACKSGNIPQANFYYHKMTNVELRSWWIQWLQCCIDTYWRLRTYHLWCPPVYHLHHKAASHKPKCTFNDVSSCWNDLSVHLYIQIMCILSICPHDEDCIRDEEYTYSTNK